MGISLEEIATLHPQLYHMAQYGSWPSISNHGLLSTTALLDLFKIEGVDRRTIEDERRARTVEITDDVGAVASIRDQRPMSDKKLASCLRDGLVPKDWYQILNRKVFFWLTDKRLKTLMGAYSDVPHLVLEIDTEKLLSMHGEQVRLAPLNTGCTSPMAFPRGKNTFLRPDEYDFEGNSRKKGGPTKAIVELTVEYSVPDIAICTRRASHQRIENGELEMLEVLYKS